MRRFVPFMVTMIVLTGCSGDGSSAADDETPEERLAGAKRNFDAADYIGFTLTAEELPADLEGLLSADGTGTHDPAFSGEVKVQTGVDLTASLVAVDGTVYAELPFVGWSELDPAAYGAPNPAELMNREGGISSLFTATTDLEKGDSERSGDQVLTTVSGTLPGEAVQDLFPSAGAADFTVNYTLTDDNDVSGATITGPFYAGFGDQTYTIDLDLDAAPVDIQAPI